MTRHVKHSVQNPRFEKIGIVTLVLGFLAINLLFVTRIPSPWMDEVMYADPAVKLLMGQGFVSTAWYAQTGERFWAGNPPLYAWLLAGWMKLFGFSLTTVRLFSYCLTLASGLILWSVAKRTQLIASPKTLLFSLLLFAYFQEASGRWLALSFLGALIPFAQLQSVAFLTVFIALALLFVRDG